MLHLVCPPAAMAQQQPVQPVPYGTTQPVPYGGGQPPPQLPPPPQQQQAQPVDAGNDIIYLKNGGILRGTIIDAIPNAHARIRLPTGEIATVRWDEVQKIVHGGARPPQGNGAPPQTPAPPPPTGNVFVHIDSGGTVQLEQLKDGTWSVVCTNPCDVSLSKDHDYRITGGGVRRSKPFRLSGENGQRVLMTVDTASSGGFALGIVAISIGAPVTLIAGLIWLVASACDSVDGSSIRSGCADTARTSGITALVGLAALVGGIVLMTKNGSTKVTQDLMQAPAPPPAPPPQARLPQWGRETATGPTLPAGATFTVPILTGRF
jgi:hypothetical protein